MEAQAGPRLVSAVLVVSPRTEAHLPATTGYVVYQAFLRLIGDSRPSLADSLHAENPVKPFTCSELRVLPEPGRPGIERSGPRIRLDPSGRYAIRFTALDGPLGELLEGWAEVPPTSLWLAGQAFHVHSVHTDPRGHPDGRRLEYVPLANRWRGDNAKSIGRLGLRFRSPTTFRTGAGVNTPLPIPRLVFGSLARKWREFAPEAAVEATAGAMRELMIAGASGSHELRDGGDDPGGSSATFPILVRRHRIRTGMRHFEGTSMQVGFEGSVEFEAAPWISDVGRRFLGLLGDFAFFSGVGYRTEWGLGEACR